MIEELRKKLIAKHDADDDYSLCDTFNSGLYYAIREIDRLLEDSVSTNALDARKYFSTEWLNKWSDEEPEQVNPFEIKWEDDDGTKHHEYIVENIVAYLLLSEKAFTNSIKDRDETNDDWNTVIYILCNDVFAWGCADAEPAGTVEIGELYELLKSDEKWGDVHWVCQKRKMQPQPPMKNDMIHSGHYPDWMYNLPENPSRDRYPEDYFDQPRRKS